MKITKKHKERIRKYIEKRQDTWNEWGIRRSIDLPIEKVRDIVKAIGYTPPGPGENPNLSRSRKGSKRVKGFTLEELRNKFDIKHKIKCAIKRMPENVLFSEEELRTEVGSNRNQKWFSAIKSEDIRWFAIQFENKEVAYGPRETILKFHAKLPDSKLLRKE